jgi:RNA polymerase sigma-70 factor (ECF subfamily)
VGVVKNIQKFKVGSEHGKFKSWLLTLTRWRIADQFRKRSPAAVGSVPFLDEDTNGTPSLEALADPASLDMDARWEAAWQQNIIGAAVARVKERVDPLDYQMFDLHVLKLWSAAKVAALLDVKLSNVYVAKYNILGRIKKEAKKIETDFV